MGVNIIIVASILVSIISFCHGGIAHYKLGPGANVKIVGGTEADPHEFPFIVNIETQKKHYCGGVIIAPRFVLTSAYCVFFAAGGSHRFEGGRHNLSADETEFQQQPTMYNYYEHPFYDREHFSNDIVVVELRAPYMYSRYIQPIQMAEPKYPGQTFSGPAVIAGWGRVTEGGEAGAYASVLRKADVEIFSDAVCKEVVGSLFDDTTICAGNLDGGVDFCQGDNGGPLVQYDENGIPTLVGIASWGYGCGRPGRPGVYNRIAHFREWILTKLTINN